MEEKKKIIKNAENFRIAYNAAIRMFVRTHDQELLEDLENIYSRYVKYFDLRTISVALRDLREAIGVGKFACFDPIDPVKDKELYDRILPFAASMLQFQMHLEKEAHTSRQWAITESVLPPEAAKRRDPKFLYQDFPIPSEEKDVVLERGDDHTLDVLAWNITEYSCGRHTYMPGVATEFVLNNRKQLSSEVMVKILDYLEKIPKYDDAAEAEACDDYMQNLRWSLEKYQKKQNIV